MGKVRYICFVLSPLRENSTGIYIGVTKGLAADDFFVQEDYIIRRPEGWVQESSNPGHPTQGEGSKSNPA